MSCRASFQTCFASCCVAEDGDVVVVVALLLVVLMLLVLHCCCTAGSRGVHTGNKPVTIYWKSDAQTLAVSLPVGQAPFLFTLQKQPTNCQLLMKGQSMKGQIWWLASNP